MLRTKDAATEVFYTAFKTLKKKQKEDLLAMMLRDREFVEDLIDIALVEQAKKAGGKPVSAGDYFSRRRSV